MREARDEHERNTDLVVAPHTLRALQTHSMVFSPTRIALANIFPVTVKQKAIKEVDHIASSLRRLFSLWRLRFARVATVVDFDRFHVSSSECPSTGFLSFRHCEYENRLYGEVSQASNVCAYERNQQVQRPEVKMRGQPSAYDRKYSLCSRPWEFYTTHHGMGKQTVCPSNLVIG